MLGLIIIVSMIFMRDGMVPMVRKLLARGRA
jgi:branched-chain amino acid transport system permease protein